MFSEYKKKIYKNQKNNLEVIFQHDKYHINL